jgi:hypothetical protein
MKTWSAGHVAALSLVLLLTVFTPLACVELSVFDIWDELLTDELEISPSFASLQAGQSLSLKAHGGKPPYVFELIDGSGPLSGFDAVTVIYTADVGDSDVTIRVSDSTGETRDAEILVADVPVLRILPAVVSLGHGEFVEFTAIGGIAGTYEFSLVSGEGTLELVAPETYKYTAPSASDTDAVVRVEDASGQASDSVITVRATAEPLSIEPSSLTMEVGAFFTFSGIGGTGSYTFSATGGIIDAGTGDYEASELGDFTITVDDGGNTATANVSVLPLAGGVPLEIVPRSVTLVLGETFQFEVLGGEGPYVFSMMMTTGGTITESGFYTAPTLKQAVETVQVEDSRGVIVTATAKVRKK